MIGAQYQFSTGKGVPSLPEQLDAFVGSFAIKFAALPLRIQVHPETAVHLPQSVEGVPVVEQKRGLSYPSVVFLVKEE